MAMMARAHQRRGCETIEATEILLVRQANYRRNENDLELVITSRERMTAGSQSQHGSVIRPSSYTLPRYLVLNIPAGGMSVKPLLLAHRFDHSTQRGYNRNMNTYPGAESTPISTAAAPDQVEAPGRRSTSYAADKQKIMARLRRMEGQVRGVQRMVDEDQYCVDVLTQLSAIIAAARQTGLLVLEDHIRGCVLGTCAHGHTNQEEMLSELSEAIERFTRSAS